MRKSNRIGASVIFLLAALLAYYGSKHIRPSTGSTTTMAATSMMELPNAMDAHADSAQTLFKNKIEPILAARCRPCHFPGGTMYAKLPFDLPKTIQLLGVKLFTRIKDQKEQELIRAFLAASSDTTSAKAHK